MTIQQAIARFSPPKGQLHAVNSWLAEHGYRIEHVSADRTDIEASATTRQVQNSLHTRIENFEHQGFTVGAEHQRAYRYYANTTTPKVPARLGLSAVVGLDTADRFFTDAQVSGTITTPPPGLTVAGSQSKAGRAPRFRSGGYYGSDLRSLYDVTAHPIDTSGQTIGFTLWDAPVSSGTLGEFSGQTGDPNAITSDTNCVQNATPGACTSQQVGSAQLLNVIEPNDASMTYSRTNVEVGLDVEAAHSLAPQAGLKYYLGNINNLAVPVADAADDPTLHVVSNSWGDFGDVGNGPSDSFQAAVNSSMQMAALHGTTFYFSSGDEGSFGDGFPASSPYDVAVGGTSEVTGAITSSTSPVTSHAITAWAAGGSDCSNLFARPAWQQVAAVDSIAPCTGRVTPDVSAIADPATGFATYYSTSSTATSIEQIGGTSLASPVMAGLQADSQAYLAQQSYGSASTPAIGFMAPQFYALGDSQNSGSYYRDVTCGNNSANYATDGQPAAPGWDLVTGWGDIDWFQFAEGLAANDGAQNQPTPPDLTRTSAFSCAPTPGSGYLNGMAMADKQHGFAAGTLSVVDPSEKIEPYEQNFLPANAWGAEGIIERTSDAGQTWQPANSDMLAVTCATSSVCIAVGDSGYLERSTDGGASWTRFAGPTNNGLNAVSCPSATVCYAAGYGGSAIKSVDAGQTWSMLSTNDGNSFTGLACPTTTTCIAADAYSGTDITTDGGQTWTFGFDQVNYYASGVSCSSAEVCVVSGWTPSGSGTGSVSLTTNGGQTWTDVLNKNTLGVTCLPQTTVCYVVGASGLIENSTNSGSTWTVMPSNTTAALTGITCTDAADCVASGANGTIDVLAGGAWSVSSADAGSTFLASTTCLSQTTCIAVGKYGVTYQFSPSAPTAGTVVTGGGTADYTEAASCSDSDDCVLVGGANNNASAAVVTHNDGETWTTPSVPAGNLLRGVSCSATTCVAVGGNGEIVRSSNSGDSWAAVSSGVNSTLWAVDCTSSTACVTVGDAGVVLSSSDGGLSWSAQSSGTTASLYAVTCTTGLCLAAGQLSGSDAVLLSTSAASGTWTAQASNSPANLRAVACVTAQVCYAAGDDGVIVSTSDGGATWTQRANPLGGQTSTVADDPYGEIGILSAACTSSSCVFGAEDDGNAMVTTEASVVTVSVNVTDHYGSGRSTISVPAGDPALTVSPSTEAIQLTGTLTCSTGATASSDVGTYPVSQCSGLSDGMHPVVYDVGDSAYRIAPAGQSITFPSVSSHTYGDADIDPGAEASSGLPVSYATSGPCTPASSGLIHVTGAGVCTVTARQTGSEDYAAASPQQQSFVIKPATIHVDALALTKVDGSADPLATGTLRASDFVEGDTSSSSDISGSPNCTIAAHRQLPGAYPDVITCGPGSLAAPNYVFVAGSPATLTITAPDRPTVASISPSAGSAAGGTDVAVHGSGFIAGQTTVTFTRRGYRPLQATGVSITSSRRLIATTPAAHIGLWTIVVTNPGGASSNHVTFTFRLRISSVSPDRGTAKGGAIFTLRGHGFVPGATTVVFIDRHGRQSPARGVSVMSGGTSLTAVTPRAPAGSYRVRVITPEGTVTSRGSLYRFVAPR